MKKFLYTTTALAAVGMLTLAPSNALAAKKKVVKPKLSVSGYMKHAFGWSSQAGSYEDANSIGYPSFNNVNDSEIYFKSKTKLDNGITVSTTVEIETDLSNAAGGNRDNSWIQLDGAFGTIRAGNTAAASFFQSNTAPSSGNLKNNHPDMYDFILRPNGLSTSTRVTGSAVASGLRYNYFTPRVAGFRASVGWLPTSGNVDPVPGTGKLSGTAESQLDYHINYNDKVGDVSLKADLGGYNRIGSNGIPDENQWRTGFGIGFGAITIGGAYQDISIKEPANATTVNLASPAVRSWSIGASYKTGPLTVAANYYNAEGDGSTTDLDEDETTQYGVQAKYNISKGVDIGVHLNKFDFDNETKADAGENDGWALITGINVTF
jgi:predicted porin